MGPGACLALVLGLAVPAENAIAPLGPSHAAEGTHFDLVVRSPDALRPDQSATFKLLLSDAATDAPVENAKVSLELFGPKGLDPIRVDAVAGSGAGVYLASTVLPQAGLYAAVAGVNVDTLAEVAPLRSFEELLATDGIWVNGNVPPSRSHRSPLLPFVLGIAAALLLFAAVRGRGRPAAAALLLLGASDARAHGAYTPPPASVPGANVFVAQEIQFALGLRTAPVTVEGFAAPGPQGGDLAPRKFLGVPRSAVVERDGHKLIFVRTGAERFVAREPKLGWTDERDGEPHVAILDGLDLDEKVVVEGAAFLRNGGAATLEAAGPSVQAPGRSQAPK